MFEQTVLLAFVDVGEAVESRNTPQMTCNPFGPCWMISSIRLRPLITCEMLYLLRRFITRSRLP